MNRTRRVVLAMFVAIALIVSTAGGCSLFNKDANVSVELKRG